MIIVRHLEFYENVLWMKEPVMMTFLFLQRQKIQSLSKFKNEFQGNLDADGKNVALQWVTFLQLNIWPETCKVFIKLRSLYTKWLSLDLGQCFHNTRTKIAEDHVTYSKLDFLLLEFNIWQKMQVTCIIGPKTYEPFRRTSEIF